MLIQATYKEVREIAQPADVVAFGGRSWAGWRPSPSGIIQLGCLHWCSHVGIVRHVHDDQGKLRVELMESTSLEGVAKVGVQPTYLSDRIAGYDGCIWLLRLSPEFRENLDLEAFEAWLAEVNGTDYDYSGAYKSWSWLFKQSEDLNKIFCSELDVAAWQKAGAVKRINPSECRPSNVCMFRVYCEDYHQLLGKPRRLRGYNTREIEGFGM